MTELQPGRFVHPSKIFFMEIAAQVAESDEDLQGEMEEFLDGGELTAECCSAIARYFCHDTRFWLNLKQDSEGQKSSKRKVIFSNGSHLSKISVLRL